MFQTMMTELMKHYVSEELIIKRYSMVSRICMFQETRNCNKYIKYRLISV